MVYWWIATALAGIVLGFITTAVLPFSASVIAGDLVRAVFLTPMFALFVRRLHDQDRSGWWALLLPLTIAISIPGELRWIRNDPHALLVYAQSGPHAERWIDGLASLATLILLMLPESVGSNRYGDDPRLAGNEDSL